MGRRWKRKNKGQKKPQKPNDPSKYGTERNPYDMVEGGNFKMEAFYAYQGLHNHYFDESTGEFKECETDEQREEERVRFLAKLKSILPASFRIGLDVDPALTEKLEEELEELVGKEMEILVIPKGGERRKERLDLKPETKLIAPAKKLSYIPHGYQLSLDRQTIRRNPQLTQFHEWLKVQTEAGFVTRQETVSMLPPIVLDVKPHHKVLDMCAAPGSKTSQILEVVNLPAKPGDTEPTGVVVANDSDSKRAYMLVHQLRRINSPSAFVTSCDAQFFPMLRDGENSTEGIFDRVLCDVPCAGDGTTRKNPGVWKKWNQLNAYGLHTLQLAIALKGVRLTKIGGYICYSTCSMNPIENEAVVAEMLRAADGSLELVDRRPELEGLVARPGMTKWKVVSETRSNRRIKDLQKKNSPKMQAKRKAWAEKEKAKKKGDDGMDVETATENAETENGVENAAAAAAASTEKKAASESKPSSNETGDGSAAAAATKEATPEGDKEAQVNTTTVFKPASYDDEQLVKYCESIGLKPYKTHDDVPKELRRRIRKSCFPPTPEEIESFHLERCMRILPHDMDTGGFFVSLFKKVAPINPRSKKRFQELLDSMQVEDENGNEGNDAKDDAKNEGPKVKKARIDGSEGEQTAAPSSADAKPDNDVTMDETAGASTQTAASKEGTADADKKKAMVRQRATLLGEKNSDTVVRGSVKRNFLTDKDGKKHATLGMDDFIPIPSEVFDPLVEYYGLAAESFDRGKYMMRACGDAKMLYLMGETVKSLIDNGIQEKVTVITSGLKGFVRNKNECEVGYRIAQDGVHLVHPHMTKRKIGVDMEDFRRCLHTGVVRTSTFSDGFAEEVKALSMGSFVVYLKGYETNYLKKLVVVMWKCRGDNTNCLVNKADMDGMLTKLRALGYVEKEPEPDAEGEGENEDEKADTNVTEEKTDDANKDENKTIAEEEANPDAAP